MDLTGSPDSRPSLVALHPSPAPTLDHRHRAAHAAAARDTQSLLQAAGSDPTASVECAAALAAAAASSDGGGAAFVQACADDLLKASGCCASACREAMDKVRATQ